MKNYFLKDLSKNIVFSKFLKNSDLFCNLKSNRNLLYFKVKFNN